MPKKLPEPESDNKERSRAIIGRFIEVMVGNVVRSGKDRFTMQQFGDSIKMSASSMSRMRFWYDHGGEYAGPTLETIAILCDVYDINPTWLLTGEEYKYKGQEPAKDSVEIRLKRIEAMMRKLTETGSSSRKRLVKPSSTGSSKKA